ncbi:N-acetylmuramoyl-L-alanine amidase [Wukongibacter baidiensis]|uniref:N-acetylmuramoyl-L-alanine amidase n=1 Tax=Wukongibacter baidiensis TaxID=1723361 RepID=UPI003D7F4B92
MKKTVSLLLVVMILMSMTITSFGVKKFEKETLHITDATTKKEYDVDVVNLIMGGKDVISDVPGMLFDSRTLVPVRFISESLGAEVSWNQENKEATIKTEEKEIVLKIDSPKVYVNGKVHTLPDNVPAKLLGYEGNFRTMVPLRFVSEQLGMEVGWIGETMTATIDKPLQKIKNITYDGSEKFPEIVIKTTGEVGTSSFFLKGSEVGGEDRLVVDLPNTILDIEDKSIVDEKGLVNLDIYEREVKSIRASQFEVKPYKTRIVVDVDKKKGYETFYDEEKKEIRIKLINSVKNIKVDNIYNVDTVVIKTAEEPSYNIIPLDGKVVIDVLDSVLKYDGEPIDINEGAVRGVRFAQFSPDHNYAPDDKITRVVVDLDEDMGMENVYIEHAENEIYVFVAGKPLDGFDYYKDAINLAKLEISANGQGGYTKTYDKSKQEVTIKLLKDSIALQDLQMDIDDSIVKDIKVNDSKSKDYYYINVKLAGGTTFKDNTNSNDPDKIVFSFTNNTIKESEYKDKLIVIDPGHGGHDPGAISPKLKMKEKVVVLDVSLKLKKLLENRGFKVYMTRDDDTYIGLYDRSTIANELGADAFVSVHANAHSKTSVEGVQVLYHPNDGRDNKTFAAMTRDALVKELGTPDKGIIQRPKLVVIRETKMPAVLLELGFMTNPREEKLLEQKDYRQKCAEGAYKGIIEYFDKVIMK